MSAWIVAPSQWKTLTSVCLLRDLWCFTIAAMWWCILSGRPLLARWRKICRRKCKIRMLKIVMNLLVHIMHAQTCVLLRVLAVTANIGQPPLIIKVVCCIGELSVLLKKQLSLKRRSLNDVRTTLTLETDCPSSRETWI